VPARKRHRRGDHLITVSKEVLGAYPRGMFSFRRGRKGEGGLRRIKKEGEKRVRVNRKDASGEKSRKIPIKRSDHEFREDDRGSEKLEEGRQKTLCARTSNYLKETTKRGDPSKSKQGLEKEGKRKGEKTEVEGGGINGNN